MMKKINSMALLKGESRIAAGERNDCVVYAVATAFGMKYDTAHKEVAERMQRQDGQGTSMRKIIEALAEGNTLNHRTVTRVIETPTKGYKVYGTIIPSRMRLCTFIKENQVGTYLIIIKDHALTIKSGVIFDNRKLTKKKQ